MAERNSTGEGPTARPVARDDATLPNRFCKNSEQASKQQSNKAKQSKTKQAKQSQVKQSHSAKQAKQSKAKPSQAKPSKLGKGPNISLWKVETGPVYQAKFVSPCGTEALAETVFRVSGPERTTAERSEQQPPPRLARVRPVPGNHNGRSPAHHAGCNRRSTLHLGRTGGSGRIQVNAP